MKVTSILLKQPEACYTINKEKEDGTPRSIDDSDFGYIVRFYPREDLPNESVVVPYHNIACIIYEEDECQQSPTETESWRQTQEHGPETRSTGK